MPPAISFESFGMYDTKAILRGEVWRLLTAVFLPAGFSTSSSTCIVLWWSGQRLEQVYGSREFVLFYLLSGVGANDIFVVQLVLGQTSLALELNGAVTASMVVLFAFHFPHQIVRIWFVLPMPMWLMAAAIHRPGNNLGDG